MRGEPLLEVSHVAKSYGRRAVLTDANLTLRAGELVGVTGENGAGKSTLLKIIAGRLRPNAGLTRLNGRLGYCPQEPLVFERLSVEENFRFFATAYGLGEWRAAMDGMLERFGFGRYRGSLVRDLSGGTRQKLNLSLALLHEPDLLLLDEPYAAFDWETYLRFWSQAERLRAAGRGLLVVSHLVYERERFDRICELAGGVLRCG